jgi:hypothetical protein
MNIHRKEKIFGNPKAVYEWHISEMLKEKKNHRR